MKVNTRIFEVKRIVKREEDNQTIIFELNEGKNIDDKQVEKLEWMYHAPNAQNHTEEQVETILSKLKELNKEVNEK